MYNYKAFVTNVVDGDTVDVIIDLGFTISTKQRLRLAGIDTPERGQQGYQEAKDAMIALTLDKHILVTTDKVSKFGYYLADLYSDEIHVNQHMIDQGFAKTYFGGKK